MKRTQKHYQALDAGIRAYWLRSRYRTCRRELYRETERVLMLRQQLKRSKAERRAVERRYNRFRDRLRAYQRYHYLEDIQTISIQHNWPLNQAAIERPMNYSFDERFNAHSHEVMAKDLHWLGVNAEKPDNFHLRFIVRTRSGELFYEMTNEVLQTETLRDPRMTDIFQFMAEQLTRKYFEMMRGKDTGHRWG